MEIRFAIIPPVAINSRAAALAKKYARLGKHRFIVDNKNLFAHITLFKASVSRKNYMPLLAAVRKRLNNFKPLNLEIKGFLVSEGGWLGLKIKPSDQLSRFRKSLFRAIKDSKLATIPELKKAYSPHITLTRFYKRSFPAIVIKDQPATHESFSARNIGLCLSRQTQVYKILNTVKLK